MHVVYVNDKPYKVITIKLGQEEASTRCDKCAFNFDATSCVKAGPLCMSGQVEAGHIGYFVPVPDPGLDEQCGVGNG